MIKIVPEKLQAILTIIPVYAAAIAVSSIVITAMYVPLGLPAYLVDKNTIAVSDYLNTFLVAVVVVEFVFKLINLDSQPYYC